MSVAGFPLTAKQDQLWRYLQSCERCPSFDEMRLAMGLRSKSGVHRLIGSLEERGYIRRATNRARAIEVLSDPHLPDTMATFLTSQLAREAKRRGLVIGHIHRSQLRVGEHTYDQREFVEIRA